MVNKEHRLSAERIIYYALDPKGIIEWETVSAEVKAENRIVVEMVRINEKRKRSTEKQSGNKIKVEITVTIGDMTGTYISEYDGKGTPTMNHEYLDPYDSKKSRKFSQDSDGFLRAYLERLIRMLDTGSGPARKER
jgi:hypothetical protein